VYQATRRQFPEGLLFTSAAVRTLNVSFLGNGYKEKREGRVGVPVRTVQGVIWVVVIINVWQEVGSS
jgi:hypothetical protein